MIKVGSIVTVLNTGRFWKNQGEVESLEGRPDGSQEAIVVFGTDVPTWYFDEERPIRATFQVSELREDEHWSTETMALRLFEPHMCHSIREPKVPLTPETPCMHEDCPDKATTRAYINIWGTVCRVYLCDDHTKQYDGCSMDEFPWRHAA